MTKQITQVVFQIFLTFENIFLKKIGMTSGVYLKKKIQWIYDTIRTVLYCALHLVCNFSAITFASF